MKPQINRRFFGAQLLLAVLGMTLSAAAASGQTIPAGSQLLILLGDHLVLSGNNLTNLGTITVANGASLRCVNGAAIYNYGRVIVGDGYPVTAVGASLAKFFNFGPLVKTGTGIAKWKDVQMIQSGTIELQGGTLRLEGNKTHNLNGNSQIIGSGLFQIDGPPVTLGANVICQPSFELAGGTLTAAGAFLGDINWSGGTLGGLLTIVPDSTLRLVGTATKTLDSVIVTNRGAILLEGSGALAFFDDAIIENNGLFELQTTNSFTMPNGGKKWFNNRGNGILRKTGSPKPFVFSNIILQNSGTLDLQAGGLDFTLNTHNFSDGTRTTGSGVIRVAGATLNVAGNLTLGPALALESGYLDGQATLNGPFVFGGGEVRDTLLLRGSFAWAGGLLKGGISVEGAASWSGGQIDGWLGIATNSTLAIGTGATKGIKGGTLTNLGLVTVTAPVTIQADGGAVIQNFGEFNLPVSLTVTTPWGGKPTLNNYGVLSLTNGFGVFNFPGRLLQFPSGRLELELAGREAGTNFSQITGVSELTLNGALAVRTVSGFEPVLGERLEIIKCVQCDGTFATYSANTPRLAPEYSPTNVVLCAAAPVLTESPVSQTVMDGTTVTFTASAYGSQPLSYQWLWNGAPMASATHTALTLTDVHDDREGNYAFMVTNFWGSVTSTQAWLKVVRVPFIVQQPQSLTVPQGGDAVFTVQAGGNHLSYRWHFGDTWIPGATNAMLELDNVTAADAGKYQVEVRNFAGAVVSAEAILTVIIPPTITEQPAGKNVNLGSEVTLTVNASGSTPFSYQWLKNGNAIPGADQSSFTISRMTPFDEGSYVVIVSNAAGYDISLLAVIRLHTPLSITTQPVSQAVNRGSDVFFSVSATGVPAPTYQWQLNGVNIPGATQPILFLANVQPSQSGKYTVTVKNSSGAVNSLAAELEVITSLLPFTDLFAGRGILYTTNGIGHGTNCGASKEAGEPTHAGKGSTTNSVWISWWAPADGIATFDTLGSDFDTVLAVYRGDHVNGLTKIAADDDAAGYHCSKVSFNAQAGTYYQIAVAGLGTACGNLILGWDLFLTSEKLPQLTQAPQDYTGNATDTIALQVLFDAFEPTTIQWFFQGQMIVGATNSSLLLANLQPHEVGGYAARLTAASGISVVSAPVDIQINTQGIRTAAAHNKFADGNVLTGSEGSTDVPNGVLPRPPPTPQRGFSGTQIFSTLGADKDPGEPNHCGEPGGASSWFFLQAPANGLIALDTGGSSFDTVLAVYTSPTMAFDSLVSVACDNNSGADGRTSQVLFPATAMTVYLIAVDGVNGASGTVNLNYTFGSPPVITTPPLSRTAPPGGSATFTVAASADPEPVTYQWQFQGEDLPYMTNAVLTVSNVQNSAEGFYAVRAWNPLGSVLSPSAELRMEGPQEPLRLMANALGTPAGSSIRVVGRANTTYVMECSSNLNDWFPLATNLTSTGVWDFVDTQTNLACRFYRAFQQP